MTKPKSYYKLRVKQVIERRFDSIYYTVVVGGQVVWSKEVFFGKAKALRAGGAAFREAAKEQEKVALRYMKPDKDYICHA